MIHFLFIEDHILFKLLLWFKNITFPTVAKRSTPTPGQTVMMLVKLKSPSQSCSPMDFYSVLPGQAQGPFNMDCFDGHHALRATSTMNQVSSHSDPKSAQARPAAAWEVSCPGMILKFMLRTTFLHIQHACQEPCINNGYADVSQPRHLWQDYLETITPSAHTLNVSIVRGL